MFRLQTRQQGIEMAQHRFGAVGNALRARREPKTKQIGNEQLNVRRQQGRNATELQEAAVETVQQQQRRALPEHSDGKGIGASQARQIPPLHGIRQSPCLRIQQLRAELLQQCGQEGTGIGSAAPTNASSKAPGVTGKGR